MPRKTMRMTEIRALANRYLAGSDPELTEFRRGVASMYEHLAMAANDYHGYNDLVQLWAGEPGRSAYIEDKACRRSYHGPADGPDAAYAQDAIDRYRREARESGTDPEIRRRAIACAQAKTVPYVIDRELPGHGTGPAWLVFYRDQHFVISAGQHGETQAFRSSPEGKITDWDDVAGGTGRTHAEVMDELRARPVDDDGRVLSPRDVLDEQEEHEAAAGQCGGCGCAASPERHPAHRLPGPVGTI